MGDTKSSGGAPAVCEIDFRCQEPYSHPAYCHNFIDGLTDGYSAQKPPNHTYVFTSELNYIFNTNPEVKPALIPNPTINNKNHRSMTLNRFRITTTAILLDSLVRAEAKPAGGQDFNRIGKIAAAPEAPATRTQLLGRRKHRKA